LKKKRIILSLNIILLLIIFLQIIGGNYSRIYLPVLWFCINIAPIQLFLNKKTPNQLPFINYLIFYFSACLITILLQPLFLRSQLIGADKFLVVSLMWLIPIQLFYWLQEKINFGEKKTTKSKPAQAANSLITEIKDFISRNEIELAIDKLKLVDSTTQNEKIEISNFEFRLEEAKHKNRLGTLSNDELSLEKNRIVSSLIELISIIESRQDKPSEA